MRGQDEIIAARLADMPVARIEIVVLPRAPNHQYDWQRPGIEWHGAELVGRIEVEPGDNPATLDLRCCYGLPVLVLADSYQRGWLVAQRVADAAPYRLNFAAPECAARYMGGKLDVWEL